MFFDLLQLIGGLILAVGYIPQIQQIIRTKSVGDLNLKTFLLLFVGITLMEIYAVHLVVVKHAGQMFLVTNTLALALTGIVTALIVKYKK